MDVENELVDMGWGQKESWRQTEKEALTYIHDYMESRQPGGSCYIAESKQFSAL